MVFKYSAISEKIGQVISVELLSRMSRSLTYGLLTIGWVVLIFWLSTAPGEQLPEMNWLAAPDKFGHFGVYAILTILGSLSVHYSSYPFRQWGVWVTIGAIAYGVLMEIIQYTFFPGRYFEFGDMAANTIGAFAGLFFVRKFIIHS